MRILVFKSFLNLYLTVNINLNSMNDKSREKLIPKYVLFILFSLY